MKNIALIGCGKVSSYGHLPAIAQSGDWRLRAIVEPDDIRRAEASEKFAPQLAFKSADQLWEIDDLDAVVVATHLQLHHPFVIAALKRGLHVLCEKPLAATLEQCQQMVDCAEHEDRLLAVNFNTRSQLAYRQIKKIVDSGRLGEIKVARFVYNWSNHQWKPEERLKSFMANGGPIMDSGVHFFDGVRLFTRQEYSAIDAQGAIIAPYENPQHVITTCKLSGGAIALIEAGWLYTKNTKDEDAIYRVELIGDKGALTADLINSTLDIRDQHGSENKRIEKTDKGFDWLYAQWAKSIDQGKLLDLASGYDGMMATQAAFTALESAKRIAGDNENLLVDSALAEPREMCAA